MSNGTTGAMGSGDARKEAVVEDIRRVAQILKKDSVRYDDYIVDGAYSVHVVCRLFGRWNLALQAAGFNPGRRNWSDQDFADGFKAVSEKLGRTPTYQEFKVLSPRMGFLSARSAGLAPVATVHVAEALDDQGFLMVGPARFELATSCTPSKRAKPDCATARSGE